MKTTKTKKIVLKHTESIELEVLMHRALKLIKTDFPSYRDIKIDDIISTLSTETAFIFTYLS